MAGRADAGRAATGASVCGWPSPGTGRRESALDYRALGEERLAAESREERRLFYVAMTRARERLILSGAAKLDAWPALENGGGGGPIAWIGPGGRAGSTGWR